MGACYPNVHPEMTDYEADMKNLKRKVEEGVDVLLTQSVFCSKIFCEFVKNCRKHGINVPIIPGIYIPYTYEELKSIIRTTQVSVPTELARQYKDVANDKEKFQELSIKSTKTMIQEIQDHSIDHIPGYHFFSMNNMTMINKLLKVINFSDAS
jgi:methylenetetrahydrofolate reductase (NADPH)